MTYYLAWYEKETDQYMGEAFMPSVQERHVRVQFKLKPDEVAGDCLVVREEHVEWIGLMVDGIKVEMGLFEYFVEARA